MRTLLFSSAFVVLWACSAMGQVNTGELRLKVTDSTGAGLKALVKILSQGNQYNAEVTTDADGTA